MLPHRDKQLYHNSTSQRVFNHTWTVWISGVRGSPGGRFSRLRRCSSADPQSRLIKPKVLRMVARIPETKEDKEQRGASIPNLAPHLFNYNSRPMKHSIYIRCSELSIVVVWHYYFNKFVCFVLKSWKSIQQVQCSYEVVICDWMSFSYLCRQCKYRIGKKLLLLK